MIESRNVATPVAPSAVDLQGAVTPRNSYDVTSRIWRLYILVA